MKVCKFNKIFILTVLIFSFNIIFIYSAKTNDKVNDELFEACKSGNIKLIKRAINKKADVNAVNADLLTPLHLVVINKTSQACELLISNGAYVDGLYNENPGDYKTPLHYAVENEDAKTVKILLDNNAIINSEFKGITPLLIACEKNNIKITTILLENDADPNMQDEKGNSPLLYAVDNNNTELVNLLIKYNANVNYKNTRNGNTSLYLAVKNEFIEIIDVLLKNNANIYEKNYSEESPYNLAKKKKNKEILSKIEEYKRNILIYDGIVWITKNNYDYSISTLAKSNDKLFPLDETYVFSPDFKKLLFIGSTGDRAVMYLLKDNGKLKIVADRVRFDGRTKISWNKDSSIAVFNMENSIWIYNTEISKLLRLTNSKLEDYNPKFTDENSIVFYRGKRTGKEIHGEKYIINIDGEDLKKIK